MNDPNSPSPRPPVAPIGALLPGAIVLIMGVGFLLSNFGLIHFQVWCLWPLFLVAVGLAMLSQRTPSAAVMGLAFAAVGAVSLLDCFHVISFNPWKLWPLFLIAFGIRILMRNSVGPNGYPSGYDRFAWRHERRQQRWAARQAWRQQRNEWRQNWWQHAGAAPVNMVNGQWLHVVAIFTEERRRITNPNFSHAEVMAAFGSCQIDLRGIGVPDHPVSIEANAVFGGVEIFIPTNWDVVLKGVGVFGGYQDETVPMVSADARRGQLIVRGVSMFGGVSVKN